MARAHLSQIFLWMLISVIAGVALRSFLIIPYPLVFAGFLAGSTILALGVSGQNRSRIIYGFIIVSFFTGIARFSVATRVNPDVASLIGKSTTAQGAVWTEPMFGPQSQTLHVHVEMIDNHHATDPFILRVVSKKYPAYEIGEELILSGKISDPADDTNHRSNAPVQEPIMVFPHIEKISASNQRPIMRSLANLKHAFETNIDAALPEPHGAFLKGLLLGERASLPADLVDSFKKTGTTHMIALSGYNITIVGRSLSRVLMLLALPFYASFWVAMSAMILFVVMTGASASAVRAGIIAVLALVAHREGRPYQMTNALACAGAVMLMFDPTLLRFDAGFQLSFLATMGIMYLSPRVGHRVDVGMYRLQKLMRMNPASPAIRRDHADNAANPFMRYSFQMKQILIETLAAELAVLPLLIYLFGYLSIISPFANMAALIAVPAAMGAGFFTGLAGFVSSALGSVIGIASWILLEYIMGAVRFFATFPYATVEFGTGGMFVILASYGAIAWKIYYRRKKRGGQHT